MDTQRILALDVGEKRIGVAVSDPLRMIASPHSVLQRKPGRKGTEEVIRQIGELVSSLDVSDVVIGLPLRTDGKTGEAEKQVREFAELLRVTVTARIALVDERFTTRQATHALLEGDVSRAERKHVGDKVAAAIILQQYLDGHRSGSA